MHMYSCYIWRPGNLTFILLLCRICVVEVVSTCCVICPDDEGTMLIWYVRRYLQDCTTSRPRRLLCIFLVFAVRTTDLTCTRMFYDLFSVNQEKGCFWNLVIRRERGRVEICSSFALLSPSSTAYFDILQKHQFRKKNMSLSLNLKLKKITLKRVYLI
jgi:hypothetical protein